MGNMHWVTYRLGSGNVDQVWLENEKVRMMRNVTVKSSGGSMHACLYHVFHSCVRGVISIILSDEYPSIPLPSHPKFLFINHSQPFHNTSL